MLILKIEYMPISDILIPMCFHVMIPFEILTGFNYIVLFVRVISLESVAKENALNRKCIAT